MVEAVPEPEPETEIEAAIEVTAEAETTATTDPEVISEQETTAELNEAPKSTTEEAADRPETSAFQNSDVFGDKTEDDQSDEPADQGATESAPEPEAPQPAISLTVVYDPENATPASPPWHPRPSRQSRASRIRALRKSSSTPRPQTHLPSSNPQIPRRCRKRTPNQYSAQPAPVIEVTPVNEQAFAPTMVPAPAPVAPAIPEDFPVDFATEVFCPGPLLHQLSTYLPYGADTLGIVGEYYWIARERGTIEAARNRASFPLRYTQAGERHEVTVRIRRNTTGGLGAAWTIDKVEPSTK